MDKSSSSNDSDIITRLIGKPRRNKSSGADVFMALFGIIFLAIGFVLVKDDLRSQGWPTTSGTVTYVNISRDNKGATSYAPTVKYSVNNTDYSVTQSLGTSEFTFVGDIRTVAYNKDQPSDGVIKSGVAWLGYLFPLVGAVILAMAVIERTKSRKRTASINSLTLTGTKVKGVVTAVTPGKDDDTRFVVSATGLDGKIHEYVSDEVIGNYFGVLDFQKNPVPIDVYIDPANPSNYYVDISDLPPLTTEKLAALVEQGTSTTPPSDR